MENTQQLITLSWFVQLLELRDIVEQSFLQCILSTLALQTALKYKSHWSLDHCNTNNHIYNKVKQTLQ